MGQGLINKIGQLFLLFKRGYDLTGSLIIRKFGILEDIVGTARIYLEILVSLDRFCNRIDYLGYDPRLLACLLLHLGNDRQINVLDRHSVERCIKKHVKLQKRLIIDRFVYINDLVFDHVSFDNDNGNNAFFFHPGQLYELESVHMVLRSGYHCRIVRIRRQALGHMLEEAFHLVGFLDEQILHLIRLALTLLDLSLLLRHQLVHIEPVSLI